MGPMPTRDVPPVVAWYTSQVVLPLLQDSCNHFMLSQTSEYMGCIYLDCIGLDLLAGLFLQ